MVLLVILNHFSAGRIMATLMLVKDFVILLE